MNNETVYYERPVTRAGVTVLPVVKTCISSTRIGGNHVFHATKQPTHVAVYLDGQTNFFRITGEEIPMSQARLECPGLDAALADGRYFQRLPD